MKKQRGFIETALMAFLLGVGFTSLSLTSVSCDFEPEHEQCQEIDK